MPFKTHAEYIASCPPKVRPLLRKIQAEVRAAVPQATPTISYNMPAFRTRRTFFYFAAFRKHVGVYPPVRSDAALIKELAPFRGPKGNLIFPLDEPLPLKLIKRAAVALSRERT